MNSCLGSPTSETKRAIRLFCSATLIPWFVLTIHCRTSLCELYSESRALRTHHRFRLLCLFSPSVAFLFVAELDPFDVASVEPVAVVANVAGFVLPAVLVAPSSVPFCSCFCFWSVLVSSLADFVPPLVTTGGVVKRLRTSSSSIS